MITKRTKRNKGTVLLEFAMILPMFLFLILFSVDMGRYLLIAGALGDATYVGTRAVAQTATLNSNGVNVGETSFNNAISTIPFLNGESTDPNSPGRAKFQVLGTGNSAALPENTCRVGGSLYVVGRGTVSVNLLTPGIGVLFGLSGQSVSGNTIEVEQRAQLRCEVLRGTGP